MFWVSYVDSLSIALPGGLQGAFSVAAKAQVPVVPVTLVGTGDLMPNAREYLLFPGKVRVVVHPAIPPMDAEAMMQQAQAAIASSLPRARVAPEVLAAIAAQEAFAEEAAVLSDSDA